MEGGRKRVKGRGRGRSAEGTVALASVVDMSNTGIKEFTRGGGPTKY